MKRMKSWIGVSLLLLAGCATAPPTGALAAASSAIGAAREAGAPTAATAQQPLALAQRELDEAQALLDRDDNRGAYGLLIRAKADADLAASLARQEQQRSEADRLARRAEALRTQTHF